MNLEALTPTERLSLRPWLPPDERPPLSPEEQAAWERAASLLGAAEPEAAVPLQTPFATLRAHGEEASPPPPTYWPTDETTLPEARAPDLATALRDWQAAARDTLARVSTMPSLSPNRLYGALYGAAQTHLRSLAVSADEPDAPLLEQRQFLGALAVCLWTLRTQEQDDAQLGLLVTDMSGLQDYLFGIADVGAGGVARSLRARSFYLSQVGTLFAWRLLERLGLPPCNLLLDSGGKFYLLFAPTGKALAAIQEARREADDWSLRETHGELALNVAHTTFDAEELQAGRFGAIWQQVNAALAQRKQERLAAKLVGPDGWQTEAFLRDSPFSDNRQPCRACRRFGQEQEGKCALCLRDARIGGILPRAQWLAYDRSDRQANNAIGAFGWRVRVEDRKPTDDAEWVVRLHGAQERGGLPAPSRSLARYVPREPNGDPIRFDGIASKSQGRPYLAYLKADVDRLGERFVFGFRREEGEPSLDSPLRVAHLSRALEWFFGGWLERTVKEQLPHCYIVYSGGDDLTLLGPHDQVTQLARHLSRTFRRLLGYPEGPPEEKDVLTLSAGIAFAPFKLPVATAVEMADRALEESKRQGRCRITLPGKTLAWREYDHVCAQMEDRLGEELLDAKRTPSAFLYHLLKYAEMWDRYQQGERDQIRFQPLLAYDIGRNVDRNRTPELHRWASHLAKIQVRDGGNWERDMGTLGVLTRLILLRRKGGERDE